MPAAARHRLPRPRARTLLSALVLVVLTAVLTALLRPQAPVGHFTSAAAHDRYVAAYATAMAEMPAPAGVREIRTGYGTVRAYRFARTGGEDGALPLVLLPGRSSGTPVWADNLPGLLALRDVWTLDLLGEPGLSVQSRAITGDADQARWLQEVLAQLPAPRVHLVGLSIGGWTATNLALHHPEHVASLTLVEPVMVLDDIPVATMVRAIPASVPWLPRSWRDDFGSWTAGGAPVEDVPVARMIETGMQGYRLRLPAPTRISEERLARLVPPVLLVLAGASVMHDADVSVATAHRALPDATVRLHPGASHAVNGEHPEEIAADLAAFLVGRG